MPIPQMPQHASERIERVKQWLAGWWSNTPELVPPPDPERVPTIKQALEQDGPLRWRILVVLDRTDEVSLPFIEIMTNRAFVEERQRSLAWLVTTDCIMEHRRWERAFFWQQRREVIWYALTPIGTALLAQINETATAEQLGQLAAYWDPHTGQIDQSRADFALCRLLAYWTNNDAEQVDRLFRQSALYRPKWDQPAGGGHSYGEVTIWHATEQLPARKTR